HDTHASQFGQVARVVSALVAPDTAAALCRAAQCSTSSWDYGLPPEDDSHLEIRQSPYDLRGWLRYRDGDLPFDVMDPLRFQVGSVAKRPGTDVKTRLGLEEDIGPPVTWKTTDGQVVFAYRAWGESPNADADGRDLYETAFRSNGHQLFIKKQALHRYLTEVGCDLIVEVEIRRNNSGYDSSRSHTEKQEAEYDRVYILKRDGSIESAEGCVGAWTTPRS